MDEPLGGQLAGGALHGGADARVVGWEEADQRQQEVGGVWSSAAEGLGERAAGRVDPGLLDLAADGARQRRPAVQVGGQAQAAGQRMARSTATQAMTVEATKWRRPPRTSQMPSSGSVQRPGNHVDGAGPRWRRWGRW